MWLICKTALFGHRLTRWHKPMHKRIPSITEADLLGMLKCPKSGVPFVCLSGWLMWGIEPELAPVREALTEHRAMLLGPGSSHQLEEPGLLKALTFTGVSFCLSLAGFEGLSSLWIQILSHPRKINNSPSINPSTISPWKVGGVGNPRQQPLPRGQMATFRSLSGACLQVFELSIGHIPPSPLLDWVLRNLARCPKRSCFKRRFLSLLLVGFGFSQASSASFCCPSPATPANTPAT